MLDRISRVMRESHERSFWGVSSEHDSCIAKNTVEAWSNVPSTLRMDLQDTLATTSGGFGEKNTNALKAKDLRSSHRHYR